MPATSQTVTRNTFATDDFEQARELLTGLYGDLAPTLRGDAERFRIETSSVDTDRFGLDRTFYGSVTENRYQPFENTLVIGMVRGGGIVTGDGGDPRTATTGDLIFHPPHRAQHVLSDDGLFDLARIDMTALGRVAHEISGIAPEDLRFHAGPAISAARVRYWDATRRWVAEDVLSDDDLADEPLVLANAFRALAHATLLAVPNTALGQLEDAAAPSAGHGEPATVRRAVEFMDAHAGEDIDITRIATEARIGPRALQAAFRQHRGQTPLGYLRQVRMDGAHRTLRTADPTRGDTVAGIAARWGFGNPGRFAVEYARVHGCSPSDTLRG